MAQSGQKIKLDLDLGQDKRKAMRYTRQNPDAKLAVFLKAYQAYGLKPLPASYYELPLKSFVIAPVTSKSGQGVDLTPDTDPSVADSSGLGTSLDDLYQSARKRFVEPSKYPKELSDSKAVQVAYRHELDQIGRFLENDLSVLIQCDKILTEHIYEYVCKIAQKTVVMDDAVPEGQQGGDRAALDRAMQGTGGGPDAATLALLIHNLKKNDVLVLRSIDILDNPFLIEILYQGTKSQKKPQLLGFIDPSLEVKQVLLNRFAIRAPIMGLPRHIQPDPKKDPVYTVTRLITAEERERFPQKGFDPEGLYKNVSGLNVVQFRDAMRYVGAVLVKDSDSRRIYDEIRQFKTSASNEIEIPDITFDNIGGYERVKQELQRIILLIAGSVSGIDERERENLIPRGFIFHGPPGTGKTLFAKAIANEMNATIQMVSGPEVMDKYVGQSESNLRQIFATARRNAPSIILFDEFDSLASQRSTYSDGGSRANNAVVAQLLTELDGFRRDQTVLVIGTTNRLDIIDEALLRPSRLKPVAIGRPDFAARQEVSHIHAQSFGVAQLLKELCQLVMEHLPTWQDNNSQIPDTFLDTIFDKHPPYKLRYQTEQHQDSFRRNLQSLFSLLLQTQSEKMSADTVEDQLLDQIEEKILTIAPKYGLDLTNPAQQEESAISILQPMQDDLQDLFTFIQQQSGASSKTTFTAEKYVASVMDLIAEYTEGFNNDEIRAIFQEASLEHHLEGQLVTPRYLGMKIGLIRQRRDERQIVHLDTDRGR